MESDGKTVELEEGWRFIATNLAKIRRSVEDDDGKSITSDDYMQLYTKVYSMCMQAPPHDYSGELYQCYKDDLDDYIRSTVLPSLLRETHGENLMRKLVERWRKYSRLVTWHKRFFNYLERHYIPSKSLPTLKQVSSSSFHYLVFSELKDAVTAVVIRMIDDERDGQLVDRDLLKNVLDVYVQIGCGSLDVYQVDFEHAFRQGTRDYYSRKAQTWIMEYSHSEYMLKVEECLQNEKERAAHYLHSSTGPKLMEDVTLELLTRGEELQKKPEDGEF